VVTTAPNAEKAIEIYMAEKERRLQMRKGTSILTLVLVIAVIPVLNSNAVAQDQSMHPQMQQNLHEMSAVMADISNQLSTGKMSPEAQKTAA
jgi:septal ring factor EnvC (AmiA/AmiB activator)